LLATGKFTSIRLSCKYIKFEWKLIYCEFVYIPGTALGTKRYARVDQFGVCTGIGSGNKFVSTTLSDTIRVKGSTLQLQVAPGTCTMNRKRRRIQPRHKN